MPHFPRGCQNGLVERDCRSPLSSLRHHRAAEDASIGFGMHRHICVRDDLLDHAFDGFGERVRLEESLPAVQHPARGGRGTGRGRSSARECCGSPAHRGSPTPRSGCVAPCRRGRNRPAHGWCADPTASTPRSPGPRPPARPPHRPRAAYLLTPCPSKRPPHASSPGAIKDGTLKLRLQ